MIRSLTLVVAWLCVVAPLAGKPAQIILIRHGEKPAEGHGLSQRGKERAAALAPFFQGNEHVTRFGTPVAIYAQPVGGGHKSLRPVQTVQPLADALKLKVIEKFVHAEYAKMIDEIMTNAAYDGKMVLICWEHHALVEMAKVLGVADPPKWHGDSYDRCWIFTYPKDGGVQFRNRPQRLLYGDADE